MAGLDINTQDLQGNLETEAINLGTSDLQVFQKGEDGVGIESIQQISSSTESEGENVMRITLTNGYIADFTVRNGKQGEKGEPGKDGDVKLYKATFDVDMEDGCLYASEPTE